MNESLINNWDPFTRICIHLNYSMLKYKYIMYYIHTYRYSTWVYLLKEIYYFYSVYKSKFESGILLTKLDRYLKLWKNNMLSICLGTSLFF